mgnify:CR=1 FL=1
MNFLAKAFSAASFKLREMVHSGRGYLSLLLLPRTKWDYEKDLDKGTGSSVVTGPLQWVQRAFPEAELVITKQLKDEQEKVPGHPLLRLIERPNPFYGSDVLWQATLFSWYLAGNAYWMKVRNEATDQIVQLWWIPHWQIKPVFPTGSETTVYISEYEYKPGAIVQKIPTGDIVHFRHSIDPNNLRLGISPLRGVLRDIWCDDEAGNWIGSLLRNSGVPGIVISPDSDTAPMQGDVDSVKEYFKEMFTRDRRGEPLVLGAKTKVEQFGFDPKRMDLTVIRNTAEERVCAAIGIPAAVVGFGTGLEATKVGATMTEMRKLAWVNGIIPLQKQLAGELQRSLLPDFERNLEGLKISFDTINVAALQEDRNAIFTRADAAVRGGWLTVGQAKRMVGMVAEPSDEIYLRSIATAEVPVVSRAPAKVLALVKADDGLLPAARRAVSQAPRARPTRAHIGAMRLMERMGKVLSDKFAGDLEKQFTSLGQVAARLAREAMEGKQVTAQDDALIRQILEGLGMEAREARFARLYNSFFAEVGRQTFEGMNTAFGLSTDLPDPAALRILDNAGRRAGLVDLTAQTRDTMFETISAARAEGLGPPAIARRIMEDIPAGPWRDSNTRARVISRTETKFAQNLSTVEYAKANEVRYAMVFDARGGPTDEECEALDGLIVDLDTAEMLASEEHPNGTRSFTPWFAALEEVA